MKTILYTLLLLLSAVPMIGQGIRFEHDMSWEKAKAKAVAEQKLLFLDFYTDWCGPCKIMAKAFFPVPEIGEAFNSRFVNLKIDAEKGEGIGLAQQYQVRGYPSLVFVNPTDEALVLLRLGSPPDVDGFVQLAQDAVLEHADSMSFAEYVERFESGDYDTDFLLRSIRKANRLAMDNTPFADAYFIQWRPSNTDPEKALKMVQEYDFSAASKFYAYLDTFREDLQKVEPTFDLGMNSLAKDWGYSAIRSQDRATLDKAIGYIQKYSDQPDMDIFYLENDYYSEDPEGFKALALRTAPVMLSYPEEEIEQINRDGEKMYAKQIRLQIEAMNISDPTEVDSLVALNMNMHPEYSQMGIVQVASILNELAWHVYQDYRDDAEFMSEALSWSEYSSQQVRDISAVWPNVGDTYSHLLYAHGDKAKAIQVQKEVIQSAGSHPSMDVEDFRAFLDEMQSD